VTNRPVAAIGTLEGRKMSTQPWSSVGLSGGAVRSLLACVAISIAMIGCGPGRGPETVTPPPPEGSVRTEVVVHGDGQVRSEELEFVCEDRCLLDLPEGSVVDLGAAPGSDRVLVGWDGPCGALDTTCRWEATEAGVVTVTFAPHALRVDVQGDGGGRFEVSDGSSITKCRGSCGVAFERPLQVAITYYPEEGSTRTQVGPWNGACEGESPNYCLVSVTGAVEVGTTWRHPHWRVTTAINSIREPSSRSTR
jgi:hypothetical protein